MGSNDNTHPGRPRLVGPASIGAIVRPVLSMVVSLHDFPSQPNAGGPIRSVDIGMPKTGHSTSGT